MPGPSRRHVVSESPSAGSLSHAQQHLTLRPRIAPTAGHGRTSNLCGYSTNHSLRSHVHHSFDRNAGLCSSHSGSKNTTHSSMFRALQHTCTRLTYIELLSRTVLSQANRRRHSSWHFARSTGRLSLATSVSNDCNTSRCISDTNVPTSVLIGCRSLPSS